MTIPILEFVISTWKLYLECAIEYGIHIWNLESGISAGTYCISGIWKILEYISGINMEFISGVWKQFWSIYGIWNHTGIHIWNLELIWNSYLEYGMKTEIPIQIQISNLDWIFSSMEFSRSRILPHAWSLV